MGFRAVFTGVVLFLLAAALFQARRGEELPPPERFTVPRQPAFEVLAAPRGTHTLAGSIATHAGLAVEGVLVELRAGAEPRWTFSDADGRFRIGELPAGRHRLVLAQPGYLPVEREVDVPAASEVSLALPEAWERLPPLPELRRAPLAGAIAAAVGELLAGCEIVLRPAPESDPLLGAAVRRTSADASGAFGFEALPLARYVLEVLPAWAAGGSWPVLARREVLHDGLALALARIDLEAGAIEGAALDSDGAPLHGALVLVSAEADQNRVWPPAATDAAGRFRVEHLAPGRYRIRLRAGERSVERLVEVRGGEVRDPGFGAGD